MDHPKPWKVYLTNASGERLFQHEFASYKGALGFVNFVNRHETEPSAIRYIVIFEASSWAQKEMVALEARKSPMSPIRD